MKVDPQEIAFDIDGVVADTMSLFMEIARRDFGINGISYSDITEYFLEDCLDMAPDIIEAIINSITEDSSGIELLPIDGAVEALVRIGSRVPLLFVTARPRLGPIKRWMLKTLFDVPSRIEVIATGSFRAKIDVLKMHGITCFVEDRLETCIDLNENDITPILFSHPWNQKPHPFYSVRTWTELEEVLTVEP